MIQRKFDGIDLKYIAMVTMLIDHIGVVFIENTRLYSIESFQMLDVCIRLIGRIAFPLFAFLLVEGFQHTSNLRNYASRLLVFAFISEIPFDLAASGKLTWAHQNVFFTLFIGLLVLKGLQFAQTNSSSTVTYYFTSGFSIIVGCLAAYFLSVDYSYMGVLLIVILYLLRDEPKKKCTIGAILFSYELTAILSFIMIYRYTGQKGSTKLHKYAFYAFYPAHLFILWVLKMLIIR